MKRRVGILVIAIAVIYAIAVAVEIGDRSPSEGPRSSQNARAPEAVEEAEEQQETTELRLEAPA